MICKWFIDGRVDGVFRLAAEVLDELLKEVAWDEGEEWVMGEAMEAPILSKSSRSHAVCRPVRIPRR
jgi:hypothetical protein